MKLNSPWKSVARGAARGALRGRRRRRRRNRRMTPQGIIFTLVILAAIWAYDHFSSDDQQPQDHQPAATQPYQGGDFD